VRPVFPLHEKVICSGGLSQIVAGFYIRAPETNPRVKNKEASVHILNQDAIVAGFRP
jgi:hypothetical protein